MCCVTLYEGIFSEEGIDQLNLRLCMSSWLVPTSNYLHQLTACVAALSAIG